MSSNAFAAPLRLKIKPSRLHAYYLIYAHAVGLLAALWPSSVPLFFQLITTACVLSSAVWFYRQTRREFLSDKWPVWIWRDTQHWRDLSNNTWQLLSNYFLSPWLIIIRLKNTDGKIDTVRIWRDQLTVSDYRKLYRRLKFARAQPDQAAVPQ